MPRGRKKGTTAPVDTVASPSKTKKRARIFGKRKKTADVDLPLAPTPTLNQANLRSNNLNTGIVRTYNELVAALSEQKVQITLANNIIAEGNILINYDVAINFNGFSIISPEVQSGARVIDIRSGEVILTGRGKIFAMGKGGVAIRVFGAVSSDTQHYTTLTIDERISLFAPDSYGILISPNLGVAYGVTVNFHGQIFAHDGICLSSGIHGHEQYVPVINIKNEAKITADEFTGAAIEAAGFGKWKIGTAKLQAATGANLSGGHLKFSNTQVLAHGANSVFNLLESSEKTLRMTVDGGNYASEQGNIIAGTAASLKKITLKSGDFYTKEKLITPELEKLAVINEEIKTNQEVEKFLEGFIEVEEFTLDEETAEDRTTIAQSEPVQIVSAAEDIQIASEPVSEELDEKAILSELLTEEDLGTQEVTSESVLETAQISTQVVMPVAMEPILPQQLVPAPVVIEPTASLLTQTIPEPLPSQPSVNLVDEREAARMALADALQEMQKINPADYPIGFDELVDTMQRASNVLENPQAQLADFMEAASWLLQAFDGLAEQDDSDLSDAELDELFYHGAVLEEMVGKKSAKHNKTAKKSKSEPNVEKLPVEKPAIKLEVPQVELSGMLENLATEPAADEDLFEESDILDETPIEVPVDTMLTATADRLAFQMEYNSQVKETLPLNLENLDAALRKVAELDFNRYTNASQEFLLKALGDAQDVLNSVNPSQTEIDDLTQILTKGLENLRPIRSAHIVPSFKKSAIPTTTPAPSVKKLTPATMIDELAPSSTWSIGVTMIDEMTPFVTDADTLEKMVRSTRPVLRALAETAASPLKKIAKSLSAGVHAGLTTYRETLHAGKMNF